MQTTDLATRRRTHAQRAERAFTHDWRAAALAAERAGDSEETAVLGLIHSGYRNGDLTVEQAHVQVKQVRDWQRDRRTRAA